jgi:hypothetical protein
VFRDTIFAAFPRNGTLLPSILEYLVRAVILVSYHKDPAKSWTGSQPQNKLRLEEGDQPLPPQEITRQTIFNSAAEAGYG